MPEKPEVQCFADALNKHIQGKVLTSLQFDSRSRYREQRPANYEALCSALPSLITRVWSKGKKVIICLKNGMTLLSSLSMEGKWLPVPLKHSNLTLTCRGAGEEEDTLAYFDDARHQGTLEILLTAVSLEERLARIGPDLLNDNVTQEQWLRKMRQASLQQKEICDVLMEQSHFSGVGNYIKAMTLHAARVRPNALLSELSDEHLLCILEHATRVIRESYELRGASLHSYKDFYQQPGKFEVLVYDREDKKDQHGNAVKETTFADKRTTHWCPAYQTIPSPWNGPALLDVEKLRRSKGRGKDTYLMHELKEFCRQHKVAQEGTKGVLVDRLLAKVAVL